MSGKTGVLLKAETSAEFNILKSDNLVIGGYASIEIVDKQNDLIFSVSLISLVHLC